MRTARTGDTLGTPTVADCTAANGTALQFIPRSRETNNPSSAAAYQASRLNAISFTLERNGTLSFSAAGIVDFAGAFELRAEPFFAVVVWRGCDAAGFSMT